jgi:hypothetical protein
MTTKNKRITLYQLLIAVVGLTGCPPPDPLVDTGDTGDTGESAAIDADGDGFTVADGDCDDSDGTIFPGADEVCDGIDNNCNGEIDEESIDALTWYLDADGDGFGDPLVSLEACEAPSGYVANDTDCDDLDGTIYPGAVDIPGDGIDQDCDGIDSVLSSPCDVEIIGDLSGEPGDEIVIQWQGGPFEDIQIRVFSGWGSENYLNTVVYAGVGSDGSYIWTLPADLDPSLDYHVYVESAQGGVPTEQCWDYAPIDVQSSVCELEFTSELSGEPGDEIDIQWDVPVGQLTEVYIAVFSGWTPAAYYLTTIEDNTGSLLWELPADLDPSLDYHAYIESAQDGVRTGQCWRYATLSVD